MKSVSGSCVDLPSPGMWVQALQYYLNGPHVYLLHCSQAKTCISGDGSGCGCREIIAVCLGRFSQTRDVWSEALRFGLAAHFQVHVLPASALRAHRRLHDLRPY